MSFPQELKDRKQWVCWRLEPDKDGGKPKKMPINPVTGKSAMSNNPRTWTDYQTAFDAYEKYSYTGIGYMSTKDDGYVGVDIDHCYDPETGEFNDVAKAIIARKPTYVEFSPSGDGVYLYFKGKKPSGSSKNTENGVEMYESGRFLLLRESSSKAPPMPSPRMTARLPGFMRPTSRSRKRRKRKRKSHPVAFPWK